MKRELILECAGWKTQNDFYEAFFEAVGAPAWHGRNLDALYDSIGAGDINQVEAPYVVKVRGVRIMSPEARAMVERFCELVHHLRNEGVEVSAECD
jgi:RNAse (barnase) inhibitor barstar